MTLDRLSNRLWNIIKLDLRRKNVLRYSLDSLESMLLGLYAFGLNAECIQSNTGNYGPQKKLRIWTFSRSVKSWVSACISTTINRGQLYAVRKITKVKIDFFFKLTLQDRQAIWSIRDILTLQYVEHFPVTLPKLSILLCYLRKFSLYRQ